MIRDLLSPNFIVETMNSLNLLLPLGNPNCNSWTARNSRNACVDPRLVSRTGGTATLGNFEYWHDRLLILSDAFAAAAPSTAVQFWHDRRDMTRWWGFWLLVVTVLLTVLFGLIQSVAGIMQVVVSMRSQRS